jgi:fumarate hydratase subunit alpha
MRTVLEEKIKAVVADLCIQANLNLRRDCLAALRAAYLREKNRRAKQILAAIIKNASIARKERLAICQDTGLPVVFIELGQNVKVIGDLKQAVTKGVELGYKKGYLRKSIVKEPLSRGQPGFTPVIIHTDIAKGNRLKITVLPKGFGCENKTQLKMFNPTAKIAEIKRFIIDAVKFAGPDACPPFIVGVGIGGTADYAAFLAQKALLKKIRNYELRTTNFKLNLEQDLLRMINQLNIGPMGLGGKTSALAVNIETYPTHIAGLAVAVNISCHALRSASALL